MTWRIVLFLGVLLASMLAAVGAFLDSSSVRGRVNQEARYAWSSPFEREVWALNSSGERVTLIEGDQRLWYFAGGMLLVVTLASVPLLRERERRRNV